MADDNDYDIAVDFMDMTDDGRLWVRSTDARPGVQIVAGRHLIVSDDDADPKVARVVSTDAEGNVELEVLQGSVESHADLIAPV